jgi:hypothetical protein
VTVLRRRAGLLVALAVLFAGCTFAGGDVPWPGASPPSGASPSPGGTAPKGTSELPPLCHRDVSKRSPEPSHPGTLPPVIARVADQVAQVRGLAWEHPVVPEPLTESKIQKLLSDQANSQFPGGELARNGRALITIGVLPAGTDLRKALIDFGTSQIIGFYDSDTGRLVFVGSTNPTPLEMFTLAHELTHALDDQHFDLSRLDRLNAECRGDVTTAYTSLAEGDAVENSVRWAQTYLSSSQLVQLEQEAAGAPNPPASVPRFIQDEQEFPYPSGQAFVEALIARGGRAAVNAAFRDPPISTEQILHPAAYPGDLPVEVEVPDFASKLGPEWRDLDREDMGEADISAMLHVHLDGSESNRAAQGWGGGQYRAWSEGSTHTAVLLETSWDSPADAGRFADAMRQWLAGRSTATVEASGSAVTVLFGSDTASLAALQAAG